MIEQLKKELGDMQGINALLVEENIELKRKLAICEKYINEKEKCDHCLHRERSMTECGEKCRFEIAYDKW